MKRCLNISLCTFVVFLSVFAMFRIDTKAKVVNNKEEYFVANNAVSNTIKNDTDNIEKEKQEILERKRLEKERIAKERIEKERLRKEKIAKEKTTVTKTTKVEKSVPKKKPIKKTNTIKYGTFGRLYIPGYSVALYDYNVNMDSGSSLQTIVNNQDSAAYYITHDRFVIADHYYQGFSALASLSEGATSYIRFKDGSIIRYRLIKKSRGVNTGPDLVDTNGNSFFNMNSDIIMYTCYEDGIMVTLWSLL